MMYYFTEVNNMYSQIEIQPAWITYIQKNSPIIFGWIRSEMINYLQKRNPSVPGIPNKLYPPKERQDITRARKYWKEVVRKACEQGNPLVDIYGKNPLAPTQIAIDHLCKQEYQAYQIGNNDETIRKLFEKCKNFHINDERIRKGLYREGKTETEFSNELKDILLPVYESARKSGFNEEWIWSK